MLPTIQILGAAFLLFMLYHLIVGGHEYYERNHARGVFVVVTLIGAIYLIWRLYV